MNFKNIVWIIKAISYFVLLRSFGNILHDLAAKYDQKLSIAELRYLEKTSTKARKARLDVNFLKNCQSLRVFPRFISFALPNTSPKDVIAIRKRLLRSAIDKRSKELKRLENERDKISNKIYIYMYIEVIQCKLSLYLKKAGLASRNIVHH